jgi:hypothetical protein
LHMKSQKYQKSKAYTLCLKYNKKDTRIDF